MVEAVTVSFFPAAIVGLGKGGVDLVVSPDVVVQHHGHLGHAEIPEGGADY